MKTKLQKKIKYIIYRPKGSSVVKCFEIYIYIYKYIYIYIYIVKSCEKSFSDTKQYYTYFLSKILQTKAFFSAKNSFTIGVLCALDTFHPQKLSTKKKLSTGGEFTVEIAVQIGKGR